MGDLCEQQRNTGYSVDGSYAEYAVASAGFVAPVPDAVDPLDAASLTCAGVTTYKAVKISAARPSDLVAVFGIGGHPPTPVSRDQGHDSRVRPG